VKRLSDALFPGARVFVPGFSGESALLLEELAADPERARSVHFTVAQYPGIGRADYLAVHPQSRQTAFFMTPAVREGMREGRAELLALDYPGIVRYLREAEPFDVVFVQLSSPDAQGWCSPGPCVDFVPLVWARAKRRIAHINPRLRRTRGSFRVNVSELDAMVEADAALLEYSQAVPSSAEERIAAHAATLVRDADTLQFGVGSVPAALARALTGYRKLKVYSGMVSEGVRLLWEAGALDRDARITTGVALGAADFYDFVSDCAPFWFTDASHTHDVRAIASIPRFIAINSAVEVDLFAQVNGERAEGTVLAGAGGLPAFAQAAQLSRNGRLLICLRATAKRGTVSRIVCTLGSEALCTLPRHSVDAVVTENGIAELRGLSMEARADALIAIAAPEQQPALSSAWDRIRARL